MTFDELQTEVEDLKDRFHELEDAVNHGRFQLEFPIDNQTQSLLSEYLPVCVGRMYQNAATAVANATWTQVAFQVSDFQQNVTTDTTNNQLVIQPSGYYRVVACVSFDTAPINNYYTIEIRVNANSSTRGRTVQGGTAVTIPVWASDILNLKQGDQITVYAFQQSGGSVNTFADRYQTYLTIQKI